VSDFFFGVDSDVQFGLNPDKGAARKRLSGLDNRGNHIAVFVQDVHPVTVTVEPGGLGCDDRFMPSMHSVRPGAFDR
jgi:hypothetical protein